MGVGEAGGGAVAEGVSLHGRASTRSGPPPSRYYHGGRLLPVRMLCAGVFGW